MKPKKRSKKEKMNNAKRNILILAVVIGVLLFLLGLFSGLIQDAMNTIAVAFSSGNVWTYAFFISIFCIMAFFGFVLIVQSQRARAGKSEIPIDNLAHTFMMWATIAIFAGLITTVLWALSEVLLKDLIPNTLLRLLVIAVVVMFVGWLVLRYVFNVREATLVRKLV